MTPSIPLCDGLEPGFPWTGFSAGMDGDLLMTQTIACGLNPELHTFTACWSGVFAEPVDPEDPWEATVQIFHDDGGDPCIGYSAWLSQFDLTSIREAWTQAQDEQSGTIKLIIPNYGSDPLEATYSF